MDETMPPDLILSIQSFSLISLQTGAIKGDMKIEFAEEIAVIPKMEGFVFLKLRT